jgi:penicillin-binding protein A
MSSSTSSRTARAQHPVAASDRDRLRRRRAMAVIALAAVAFLIGAILGGNQGSSPAHSLAARFTTAWAHRDYATMYSEVDAATQRSLPVSEFAELYNDAATTATLTTATVTGRPRDAAGGVVVVPVRIHTRLFGVISSSYRLQIAGSGASAHILWSRSLAFPGLRSGEQLQRHTTLPPRASLLARDGSVLASGSAQSAGERSSALGSFASAVVGSVGPIASSRLQGLEAEGVPAAAIVGQSGLERALDDRLRGTPGGQLLAVSSSGGAQRVLASVQSHATPAVRSTVSPALQRAAVTALGGQLGGIVALEPSSGAILAVAGIGTDDLQPPGSTFKMITLTAALAGHVARPQSTYPYETAATLDGVKLNNANGESCGGSLALAFAVSCNSVFAPLGVKIGAPHLVATAERFGFNHEPGIAGAVESTLPPASQIQGELDVGSTAIGQGQVQASALEMAIVAATIADGGRRPQPTFTYSPLGGNGSAAQSASYTTVMSSTVAHTVRRLMIGVVREGTGHNAAIPGVTVAGKTGTAELTSASANCASGSNSSSETKPEESSESGSCAAEASNPKNTDAWFAAFAPALHPRIVVAVLLVQDGAGGDTAAPVARQVIEAALQLHL